jgi:hypothetical protein
VETDTWRVSRSGLASKTGSVFSGPVTLDVGDLTALVFHKQRGTSAVLDNTSAVGKAVYGLTVFNGLYQRGDFSFPRRTTMVRSRTGFLPLRYRHDFLLSLGLSWS